MNSEDIKVDEQKSNFEILKSDLKFICNHYGVKHQIKRVQSEVFELNEAILDYEKAIDDQYVHDFDKLMEHVIEEYADVFNMLLQIIVVYNIKIEDIFKMMRKKADKQLNKMKTVEDVKKMLENL